MSEENEKSGVWLTITGWAKELGFDPKTVAQRMRDAGHAVERNSLYHVKQVVTSIYGDKEAEQIRALKLENQERERNAAKESGALFPMSELEPILMQSYVAPMSNILNSLPTSIDTRCNPDHPEIARKALLDWVENTAKPLLKTEIEKLMPK
jgi:hypothetical protein